MVWNKQLNEGKETMKKRKNRTQIFIRFKCHKWWTCRFYLIDSSARAINDFYWSTCVWFFFFSFYLNWLPFGGPTTTSLLKFQKSHLKSDGMKCIWEEMSSILRIFRRFRGFPLDRYTSKVFQCMQISFKGINAFSFSTCSARMNSAAWDFPPVFIYVTGQWEALFS